MRLNLRLGEKMGLTICAILLFTIALNALLNYFNFERSYSNLVRDAYKVTLKEISNGIEYGMALGLSLPAMNNIPEILVSAIAEDESIQSIRVFDAQSQPLFQSGADASEPELISDWQALIAQHLNHSELWTFENDLGFGIGLTLVNGFGVAEGALVLQFSRAETELVLGQVRRALIQQSLIVFVVFGALSIVLAWLCLWNLSQSLGRMERSLVLLSNGEAPSYTQAGLNQSLEQEFIDFQEAILEARNQAQNLPRKDQS